MWNGNAKVASAASASVFSWPTGSGYKSEYGLRLKIQNCTKSFGSFPKSAKVLEAMQAEVTQVRDCDVERSLDTIRIIRWLHPGTSVGRTVAVLKGYFDDSGTHSGSLVVATGGFIAREAQWLEFEHEWRKLQTRYGFRVFRMSTLENRQGEFFGWSEERKKQLIGDVEDVVRMFAKQAISGLVVAQDYDEVVPAWAKATAAFGSPYNFCFQMCVAQAMGYVESLRPSMPDTDQIAFMFEQQSKHEGLTSRNYSLD